MTDSTVEQFCKIYGVTFATEVIPEKNFKTVTHYTSMKQTIAYTFDGEPTIETAEAAIDAMKSRALRNV